MPRGGVLALQNLPVAIFKVGQIQPAPEVPEKMEISVGDADGVMILSMLLLIMNICHIGCGRHFLRKTSAFVAHPEKLGKAQLDILFATISHRLMLWIHIL